MTVGIYETNLMADLRIVLCKPVNDVCHGLISACLAEPAPGRGG